MTVLTRTLLIHAVGVVMGNLSYQVLRLLFGFSGEWLVALERSYFQVATIALVWWSLRRGGSA
jgi:predicted tellurium resistance membrane protein TerC